MKKLMKKLKKMKIEKEKFKMNWVTLSSYMKNVKKTQKILNKKIRNCSKKKKTLPSKWNLKKITIKKCLISKKNWVNILVL
jgi:hypothetical protein